MVFRVHANAFLSFLAFSLPLEGMKRKIMRNLRTLETEGMVNSKNDYQEIVNAIAKVRSVFELLANIRRPAL